VTTNSATQILQLMVTHLQLLQS